VGRFTGPLILREDGYEWSVERGFTYVTNGGDRISIPKGFRTDLASVPQIFQSIIPKTGLHNQPAVVHDFLYAKSRNGSTRFTKRQADKILREGILDKERIHEAEYSYADVIYHAVCVGGRSWGPPRTEEEHEDYLDQ